MRLIKFFIVAILSAIIFFEGTVSYADENIYLVECSGDLFVEDDEEISEQVIVPPGGCLHEFEISNKSSVDSNGVKRVTVIIEHTLQLGFLSTCNGLARCIIEFKAAGGDGNFTSVRTRDIGNIAVGTVTEDLTFLPNTSCVMFRVISHVVPYDPIAIGKPLNISQWYTVYT